VCRSIAHQPMSACTCRRSMCRVTVWQTRARKQAQAVGRTSP
jgi:hypothetical protein